MLAIGKVVGAHGIRGEVTIHFYGDSDRPYQSGDLIRIRPPGQTDAAFKIISARPHKRNFLFRFEHITDRDGAERLIGAEVVMDRSDLPPLDDGEYYWSDLIGMSVHTTDGDYLGTIAQILPTGSNDVYVVQDGSRETLVPALDWVVVEVDVAAGTMRVDLPEGL